MDFDLEGYVDSIIQIRNNGEQAQHVWLNGFYCLINNSTLSYPEIESYLAEKLSEHKPFTKFTSSVQTLKLTEALLRGEKFFESPIPIGELPLFSERGKRNIVELLEKIEERREALDFFHVHLPVNDSYHLEFPLLKKWNLCEFIYTSCELCKDTNEHGFPEISLRKSVYFKESELKGMMYDNRISVNHQNREVIVDSYNVFKDFIEATKVET